MEKYIWKIENTIFSTDDSKKDMKNGDVFYRIHSFTIDGAAEQLCGFSADGFSLIWCDQAPDWVNNPAAKIAIV